VLDRKGWWKGAKRGERRGTERNWRERRNFRGSWRMVQLLHKYCGSCVSYPAKQNANLQLYFASILCMLFFMLKPQRFSLWHVPLNLIKIQFCFQMGEKLDIVMTFVAELWGPINSVVSRRFVQWSATILCHTTFVWILLYLSHSDWKR
jgi:hypothetical protein